MRIANTLALAILCISPVAGLAQQQYGRPNVWIDVSEDLLDDAVVRTIDRPEIVKDVILDTPLTGTGTVRAASDLVIEPHADRAVFKIVVSGEIDTHTVGRSGPARVHSHTITSFDAEKKLLLDAHGLTVLPAACEAHAKIIEGRVVAAKAGIGSRIVRRVGQRRWQGLRESAEREVAEHAQQRVMAAIDREADELLERLDRLAVAPMLAWMGGQEGKPGLRFRSEKGVLRIGLVLGLAGASSDSPPYDGHRFVAVHLHSTLIEQLVARGWNSGSGDSFLLGRINPSLAWLDRIGATRRASAVVWRWVDQTIDARPTLNGISLRDGRWGALVPTDLGTDWLSVKWQPVESQQLAVQPRPQSN